MSNPWEKQIGGEHYKKYAIQPTEYAEKNGLSFAEGCIVKYVTRWRDKGGVEDLKKIIHYAEILINIEQSTNRKSAYEALVDEASKGEDVFSTGYASISDNWYITDNSALNRYWKRPK